MVDKKLNRFSKDIIISILQALHYRKEKVKTSFQIADEINVSHSTAEVYLLKMRELGLITSKRGPNGGYMLNKPYPMYTIKDLFEAFPPTDWLSRGMLVKYPTITLKMLTEHTEVDW